MQSLNIERCRNAGRCIHGNVTEGNYSCDCPAGWTGARCEIGTTIRNAYRSHLLTKNQNLIESRSPIVAIIVAGAAFVTTCGNSMKKVKLPFSYWNALEAFKTRCSALEPAIDESQGLGTSGQCIAGLVFYITTWSSAGIFLGEQNFCTWANFSRGQNGDFAWHSYSRTQKTDNFQNQGGKCPPCPHPLLGELEHVVTFTSEHRVALQLNKPYNLTFQTESIAID